MNNPECPECGTEMVDANEGRFGLRFGPPAWECPNPGCPLKEEEDDERPVV